MTAESVAKALGGHRVGATWTARCPEDEDRVTSLSIGYGCHANILVHCFAGCDANSVIAALRERGLWPLETRIDRPSRGSVVRLWKRRRK